MNFSDINSHRLLSLCTDFRHAIEKAKMNHEFNGVYSLENFPNGSCGYTCELLHEYLNEYRIPTYYIWGSDLSGQTHAWLALAETVQVYYEPLPTNYLEIIAKYDSITQNTSTKHYNLDNSIIIDITGDQFKDKSEFLIHANHLHYRFRHSYSSIVIIYHKQKKKVKSTHSILHQFKNCAPTGQEARFHI